ncbi:hypothetical protein [Phreatobacter stygius]|uniref:SPOR domain-containing protein n=1 Tax=Phreatobacter stygius TaxID=1940610 RepID=A0A4D7BE15_9HYPH|nr:hypothetical protein [Phreatobacter stygius]QCI68208.1 hypothetical protein E8M01_30680 [Phreatobacter stygius]
MLLRAKKAKTDDPDEVKADGLTDEPPQRLLSRLATWAGVALICSGAAIMAARTEGGSQRLARLFEPAPPPVIQRAEAPRPAAADPLMLYETRRLADAVRSLSAEREALAERVAAMERSSSQGDVTASIPQREPPAVQAAPREPQPVPRDPQPAAREPQIASTPTPVPRPGVRQVGPSVEATASVPAPSPAAQESTAIRTEFGVDLAGELSMDALRSRWQQLRAQHGPLLEGLRPLVAVQDGARPGTVDLRLVAGPLANANAATRLCASLATAGVNCKPAVFDGQRLALR